MTDSMMQFAIPFVDPPVCKVCGSKMHFALSATSRTDYTGTVWVECVCGDYGKRRTYALYGTSIPELWDVLRDAAAAYERGEKDDG